MTDKILFVGRQAQLMILDPKGAVHGRGDALIQDFPADCLWAAPAHSPRTPQSRLFRIGPALSSPNRRGASVFFSQASHQRARRRNSSGMGCKTRATPKVAIW